MYGVHTCDPLGRFDSQVEAITEQAVLNRSASQIQRAFEPAVTCMYILYLFIDNTCPPLINPCTVRDVPKETPKNLAIVVPSLMHLICRKLWILLLHTTY